MSLAVLKRKSRHFKAPISGQGTKGFSINGGYRNQGWVGQDTLGRHLGRTPYRGVVPVGHGGTQGEYKQSIVKGGPCSANDYNIIKRSTMTTSGYLDATVREPTAVFNSSCKYNKCALKWVQDFNPLNKTQSDHIKKIKAKAANCDKTKIIIIESITDDSDTETDIDQKCQKTFDEMESITTCKRKAFFVGKKKFYIAVNQKERNKISKGAVDSSQYTDTGVLSKNNLPTPPNKSHFPMVIHNEGCNTNYKTPMEAISAGVLPPDWMQ